MKFSNTEIDVDFDYIIVNDINWAKVEYPALENKGHSAKEFE